MKSLVLVSALFLAACGGGGGGSSPTPPVVVTPPPTVSVSLSVPKVRVGESAVLTWSSTGATSCTGLDGLAGIKPISGTETITASKGGQYKYTISCDGAGGTFKQTAALAVPYPVQRTSYLNFKNTGLGQITYPNVKSKYPNESISGGIAFGDFFQDGSISAVTNSGVLTMNNSTNGHIQFYKQINGQWVDKTSDLIDDDRNDCVGARKILVADFNGDQKPDAFFACHGMDVEPFPGDRQVWLYSQPNGKYKKVVSSFLAYAHGAAAADFKGDGFADIIMTDTSGSFKKPQYLRNNKNETFTPSISELPTEMTSGTFQIYTIELVDVNKDGLPDLYVGGHSSLAKPEWAPRFFINNNGVFSETSIKMPVDPVMFAHLDILVEGDIVTTLVTDYANAQYKLLRFDFANQTSLEPLFVPANDVPMIIRDPVKGIVTLAVSHP